MKSATHIHTHRIMLVVKFNGTMYNVVVYCVNHGQLNAQLMLCGIVIILCYLSYKHVYRSRRHHACITAEHVAPMRHLLFTPWSFLVLIHPWYSYPGGIQPSMHSFLLFIHSWVALWHTHKTELWHISKESKRSTLWSWIPRTTAYRIYTSIWDWFALFTSHACSFTMTLFIHFCSE